VSGISNGKMAKLRENDREFFMKEALKEARLALERDEVPIGAVIVIENKIIARAHNLTETLTDVTAHAEMQAFTSASGYLGGKYLDECTLYVTIEPCVMCAGAMVMASIPSWSSRQNSCGDLASPGKRQPMPMRRLTARTRKTRTP